MTDAAHQEIFAANQKLLDAIVGGDWKTYADLCDPTLTCLEPEARGHVMEGMAFHKFYFDLPAPSPKPAVGTLVTMARPHSVSDSGARRPTRRHPPSGARAAGEPVTAAVEETRVWQKQGGAWKHVHVHRSLPS